MDQSSLSTKDTQPIRKFALFFRGYNVGLSLLVAAVPVLIGVWDFIPLYNNTKIFLTGVTSLGSYLLVGFAFSQRISIGRLYFIGASRAAYDSEIRKSKVFRLLPLMFMIISMFCFYAYLSLLNLSIKWVVYDNISSTCDAQSLSLGQRSIIRAEFVAFGKRADVTVYCERSNDQKNDYISYRVGFPD
jgi:hypothetical protein